MARVLLLVPSSTYRAGAFLDAARALGIDVIIGAEESHALGGLMGARTLEVPFDDPAAGAEAIVTHDAIRPIDAVVAVDDRGTIVAAWASERLGLRHNRPDAVAAARDKLVMRTRLQSAEVPQPTFRFVPPGATAEQVAVLAGAVGLPCVVKPPTLSGSQGVLRADSAEEAAVVVERVRRIADAAGVEPSAPLLVESFVPGAELAVEAILDAGAMHVLAIFDKPDPLDGPAFEETIYVTPSRLAQADLSAAVAAMDGAIRALGLTEGPVHGEVRVNAGRASVIEVAARTIGGLCARTLTFGTGRSLEELVLAHALGMPLGALSRSTEASGVLMIPIPRAGIFRGVDGSERALAIPGVTGLELTIAPGRPVAPVPEGNRYLGFVFARGREPVEVEFALRTALATLDVRVEGTDDAPGGAVSRA
ncbi:MAG: ATP-grasp domain-containing protein [Acidimicrobiales bacterium]